MKGMVKQLGKCTYLLSAEVNEQWKQLALLCLKLTKFDSLTQFILFVYSVQN